MATALLCCWPLETARAQGGLPTIAPRTGVRPRRLPGSVVAQFHASDTTKAALTASAKLLSLSADLPSARPKIISTLGSRVTVVYKLQPGDTPEQAAERLRASGADAFPNYIMEASAARRPAKKISARSAKRKARRRTIRISGYRDGVAVKRIPARAVRSATTAALEASSTRTTALRSQSAQSPASNYPNDPLFEIYQPYLRSTGIRSIWNDNTGDNRIKIAIIDSGFQLDHPDLQDKLWTNPGEIAGNNRDDDGNGYRDDTGGWDFVSQGPPSACPQGQDCGELCMPGEDCAAPDNDTTGLHFHGTHVAGIAAAATNNAIGIASACPECELVPVRAGYGALIKNEQGQWEETALFTVADAITAIEYAVKINANVVNMSFGAAGKEIDDALGPTLRDGAAKGVIFVAAAGNAPLIEDMYPAANEAVISVTALSDDVHKLWPQANRAGWITCAAPGENIASAGPGSAYFQASGTSAAAPIVSGLIGLMLTKETAPADRSTFAIRAFLQSHGSPITDENGQPVSIRSCDKAAYDDWGADGTSATPTATPDNGDPNATPTATPTATRTPVRPIGTPTPTWTPGGPTATPTPTPNGPRPTATPTPSGMRRLGLAVLNPHSDAAKRNTIDFYALTKYTGSNGNVVTQFLPNGSVQIPTPSPFVAYAPQPRVELRHDSFAQASDGSLVVHSIAWNQEPYIEGDINYVGQAINVEAEYLSFFDMNLVPPRWKFGRLSRTGGTFATIGDDHSVYLAGSFNNYQMMQREMAQAYQMNQARCSGPTAPPAGGGRLRAAIRLPE